MHINLDSMFNIFKFIMTTCIISFIYNTGSCKCHTNSFLLFLPQEGKLKDSCLIGPLDIPLEDKTVTIVYGTDMVNVDFVNFVCASRDLAAVSCLAVKWVESLGLVGIPTSEIKKKI